MQIPDYFEQDGDTLTLYPSRFYLSLWILATSTVLAVFILFPLQTVITEREYAFVVVGAMVLAILTIGFAREFLHKQPILVLTKTTITTRGIPFYPPKTLTWSEVVDIQLVREHRNNWIFVYGKPEPRSRLSWWKKMVYHKDALKNRRYHITATFLPCPPEELCQFLCAYKLEQYTPLASLKKPELVIFDCDGVLVDGEILSYETYAKVFAQENFNITPSDLMSRYSGLSLADMISKIEKTEQITFSSAILDKIDQAIREVFVRELKPVDGVVKLLEGLKQQNIPVCVVSNGLRSRIDCALAATGLKKYFSDDRIFDVSLVKQGKPAPYLFMYAAQAVIKQSGHYIGNIVVIDDSVAGVTAAKAADMPVIGFLGGSHAAAPAYQKRVRQVDPTATAMSMAEVSQFLGLE